MASKGGISRRSACASIAAGLGLASGLAGAQDFPNKPLRIVLAGPVGSGPDIDIRQLGVHLANVLGQPVVVENRPGGGGRVAIDAVLKAPRDGHTLYVGSPGVTTMATVYPRLGFDPRRDLVPVSLASVTNFTLTINAQIPAKTLAEYVKLAQADSKLADFGTFGAGSINHLRAAQFASMTGIDAHYIHYSTSSPFTDLASGQIGAMFCAMLPVAAQVRAGRLRTLATSGRVRHPMMPDVPTFIEAGFADFDPQVWTGVMAPAGTPVAAINRLSTAVSQVARMPEMVALRRSAGSESLGSTPDEFATFLEAERIQLTAVIKKIGLSLD